MINLDELFTTNESKNIYGILVTK